MDPVAQQTDLFLKALAGTLRSIREARGLSQIELAERAGVSRTCIAYIEDGARRPTADTLKRLSSALSLPLHQIIRASEEPGATFVTT
ncbi:helix-turn-helix transcriptional regulator [Luteolibacter ambystomatis]|uniref:Helix-turn-helix transcriptional regulator n=1 Tax=Luteolibacter ambystomatis TaxID=2824561 RepID=A0A975G4V8_9BACT|nr:helix-turn-helix transcriptional regulator [Luteolibacter ambystomatis]QUE49347.1 helix-turn-helix transcriptional regulator [Luteolibacter ambystomatis]